MPYRGSSFSRSMVLRRPGSPTARSSSESIPEPEESSCRRPEEGMSWGADANLPDGSEAAGGMYGGNGRETKTLPSGFLRGGSTRGPP